MVQNCARERLNDEWCSFSPGCRGWGCRLLRIKPEFIPTTERERGLLFSKVYSEAEKLGVLDCPFYRPTIIDEAVEDTSLLAHLLLVE